jgi:hypothetical protein
MRTEISRADLNDFTGEVLRGISARDWVWINDLLTSDPSTHPMKRNVALLRLTDQLVQVLPDWRAFRDRTYDDLVAESQDADRIMTGLMGI